MTRACRGLGRKPWPLALYRASMMCRPSKRAGSTGLVTAPNGGRAIGCMRAYGSAAPFRAAALSSVTGAAKTANLPSRGQEPVG